MKTRLMKHLGITLLMSRTSYFNRCNLTILNNCIEYVRKSLSVLFPKLRRDIYDKYLLNQMNYTHRNIFQALLDEDNPEVAEFYKNNNIKSHVEINLLEFFGLTHIRDTPVVSKFKWHPGRYCNSPATYKRLSDKIAKLKTQANEFIVHAESIALTL